MDHEEVLELLSGGPECVADWNRQQPILTSELANLVGTDRLFQLDSSWRLPVYQRLVASSLESYNSLSTLGDGDVGLPTHGFKSAHQRSGGSPAATVGCTLRCDPTCTSSN